MFREFHINYNCAAIIRIGNLPTILIDSHKKSIRLETGSKDIFAIGGVPTRWPQILDVISCDAVKRSNSAMTIVDPVKNVKCPI
jgi:hypothetical protein